MQNIDGWRPTHRLVDEDGNERGEYRRLGLTWVDAVTWSLGGQGLLESERLEWGWTAVPLAKGGAR